MLLSVEEASSRLGISSSTLRNWMKAGHVQSAAAAPLRLDAEAVTELAGSIRAKRFGRLCARANKSASADVGVCENSPARAQVARLLASAGNAGFHAETLLHHAALAVLRREDETACQPGDAPLSAPRPHAGAWRRKSLAGLMHAWRERLPRERRAGRYAFVDDFVPQGGGMQFLELLYQALSPEGDKVKNGSYFTPAAVVADSVNALGTGVGRFLDPCCGTGRYLVAAAARHGLPPDRVHGCDLDPVAAMLARLNLLLWYRGIDVMPDVRCLDALSPAFDKAFAPLAGGFDAVATNPPWGARNGAPAARDAFKWIRTGETFSLFLEKALSLVRQGGRLSFVLPESVLRVRMHRDVREMLLSETAIAGIARLGRVFGGVFTAAVRVDVEKRAAPPDWKVSVTGAGRARRLEQRRFRESPAFAFDIMTTPGERRLLDKVYAVRHRTLKDNAEWALGIVTGDNEKRVLDRPAPGAEPVFRGCDVFSFELGPPRRFIAFAPERMQQVAPERLYRAPEKLIYRFVSNSLVFAYDDRGVLTLNSANILIPKLPGLPVKAVLGYLNSKLFQYVFSKKFPTCKVLRGDLETMPFPVAAPAAGGRIARLVDRRLAGEEGAADEIDALVYKAFRLDPGDVAVIEACAGAAKRRNR